MISNKVAILISCLLLSVVPAVVADDGCKSIYDIACETTGLLNFCGWIHTTGTQDLFSRKDSSLTVFAPINEAIISMDFIADQQKLREVVLFTVHDGALRTDEMECEPGINLLRMASGKDSRTICEKYEPMFQKGGGNSDQQPPKIVSPDIEACNGVIHMVDTVLLPGGFQNVVPDSSIITSSAAKLHRHGWYAIAALIFFMYQ
mmetsp:Transcript_13669/g.38486  ORF Transcript_13669/g.38486 Transcript_13669/m.38486 type:complete len:204 (+) Transcript_13669:107-718(+)